MSETLPEVPTNDPTRFCRLCFSQQSIHWVIRTVGTEVDLPFVNTIGECLGLWLSLEEDFPCAVCRRCTRRLEEYIRFREACRRCDEAIRNKRREDPSALVLFYDYPEDKVFINGATKPGFLPDDPDFENEPILPEVLLEESNSTVFTSSGKRLRMSRTEKQLALKSYMESYDTWSTEISHTKDDDEMTIGAPETMEQENLPELAVLCERYEDIGINAAESKPKMKKKSSTISLYPCRSCELTFRTRDALDGHNQIKHSGSKGQTLQKSKCPDCGQMFMSVYQMRLHAVRHRSNLLISCPTCGIQFITQNELKSHLKNNGCRLKSFGKCKYCDRTFSRRGRYIFHLKRLHPDKPIPGNNVVHETKPPCAAIQPNPQVFTDMKRTNSGSHGTPIEEHGRFVVMLEPLSVDVLSNASSNESCSEPPNPKNKNLVCTLCYERFDSLSAFNTHQLECFNADDQTGQPLAPYTLCSCDVCMEVFEAVDPFVEHLREHEQPLQIKPHDCVQCSSGRKPKFLLHPHSPSMILGD